MTVLTRSGRIIAESSPVLTLAALLLMQAYLPNHALLDPEVAGRQRQVAAAMNALPYTLGAWVGTDIEVPPAAVRLLHPNALLSRRYERLRDDRVVNLLMVHCSDARDMVGHYPPVCYPSSGWSAEGDREGAAATLDMGGTRVPAQMYEFSRILEHGRKAGIRIFNVFILPDGTLTREMDDIYRQSERLAVSVQGAAQIQLITSLDMSIEDSEAAASEILGHLSGMFTTFGVGGARNDA